MSWKFSPIQIIHEFVLTQLQQRTRYSVFIGVAGVVLLLSLPLVSVQGYMKIALALSGKYAWKMFDKFDNE